MEDVFVQFVGGGGVALPYKIRRPIAAVRSMPLIVAIEGLDGAGKTALAKAIQRRLRKAGIACIRANFSQTAYAKRTVSSDSPELRYLSLYASLHHLIAKLNRFPWRVAIMDRYLYSIESYYRASTGESRAPLRVLGSPDAEIKILLVASSAARTERISSRKKTSSPRKLATLSGYGAAVQAEFDKLGPWSRFDTTSGDFGMIADYVCTEILPKGICTHASS